jgi:carbamoyl-phosphate synthase large subunit
MNIAFNSNDLTMYLEEAAFISKEYPVVISKFIVGAKEIEVDAVAQNGKILVDIVSEHVENAGVHSGDATIVCPPQKLYSETLRRIKIITAKIAQELKITGPFNIQLLAKDNEIKVIECNLRASRSFPFVSKVTGVNLIEIATYAIVNQNHKNNVTMRQCSNETLIDYVGVKAPQFSFSRIKGADPVLRVEMASTGEVGALGQNLEEAYLKSILSTGFNLPRNGVLLSLGGELNKARFITSAKMLTKLGLTIYATHHTANYLQSQQIGAKRLYKLHELPQEPNIKTFLLKKKIDLVIIINDFDYKKPIKIGSFEVDDDYELRRTAVDLNVPILTDLQTAQLFVRAICKYRLEDLEVKEWGEY